jgi:hypothetical protein
MLTLFILFALNVVSPGEMACTDSVKESTVPMDIYIAGVELEGVAVFATQDQIVYLNGPGVSSLKPGTVQSVIRPEGKIHDSMTGARKGFYYKDIGTIQIESVQQESATAKVILSCQGLLKGDIVAAHSPKPAIQFNGDLSNKLTQIPQNGLITSIMLGKDDVRQLSAGNLCFIGLGKKDGVAAGDRFTAFRPNPTFDQKDMVALKSGASHTYSPMRDWLYQYTVTELLRQRKLPPVVLGDIVVVDTGDTISTGKIINSLSEIYPGDLIVKR